jgi:ABC-2 type transport system ATP-binding protein
VLLSSHNLSEVEEYCNRVAFIKDGSILAVIDLAKAVEPQKIVTLTGGSDDVFAGLDLIEADGKKRKFRTALTGSALLDVLSVIDPTDFTVQNESMEEYFWNLYGEGEVQ